MHPITHDRPPTHCAAATAAFAPNFASDRASRETNYDDGHIAELRQ
jgi:hypothetical protein